MKKNREQMMRDALTNGLDPTLLEIIDDSASHAGHAGHIEAGGGMQTHFILNIESAKFNEMRQLDRQKLVYSLLDDVFADGVHSISMKTSIPST